MRHNHLISLALGTLALCSTWSHAQSLLPTYGTGAPSADNDALLFHLSCDEGLNATVHQGNGEPNFVSTVTQIEDGAIGKAFHCGEYQMLTYWAPGNIYAQRGTLSFFWRSSMPLTDTEFPLFRVAYADHSSWDMVWLRIDYNGHGFDAFVTDNGLARTRISYKSPKAIDPDHWYHLAFTWDENRGIRLYVDGKLAGERKDCVVLNTGLDQFGTFGRIISPYQVQTAYNCVRGGDIDELRIYAQPLSEAQIANLARREAIKVALDTTLPTDNEAWRAWQHYYGFDAAIPALPDTETSVRKVAIHDAWDLKRWWWKGCDGIRETTWPGVYNRSTLPGRFDYIQLPDWDCYSLSGQRVRFELPDEPWNHLEITAAAHGKLGIAKDKDDTDVKPLTTRASGQHHSVHRLDEVRQGQAVVFDNDVQEMPINEFDAYYVTSGKAPKGILRLSYSMSDFTHFDNAKLQELQQYIAGRHPLTERQMLLALPAPAKPLALEDYFAPGQLMAEQPKGREVKQMPLVHVVIPNDVRDISRRVPFSLGGAKSKTSETGLSTAAKAFSYSWRYMQGGLDGILVELPALDVQPTAADGTFALNLQVKDPVWPLRNMFDFTFSVRPGQAYQLWLDMRDRILPNDEPLYLTLAGSGMDFGAEQLRDMRLHLVFKDYEAAKAEHVADRMTQVIDNYAMIVEEDASTRRLRKYGQIEADMEDLLRVEPQHDLCRRYWFQYNKEQLAPAYKAPKSTDGTPQWATLQLELLHKYRDFIEWYIDNRQIENGEFGGGLSDDSDLGNFFPGLIHMGVIPEKASASLHQLLEACYDQGLLTNGISSLKTDGLHTYEEGTNCIVQANIVEQGDPQQVERMMEAAHTVREWLLGTNPNGHLHFRSDYFSATSMATEGLWVWSTPREFLHLAPALMLGDVYGQKDARKYVLEFANSMLAHATKDAKGHINMPVEIHYLTDEVRRWGTNYVSMILWYSYCWTGDKRYLEPLLDSAVYQNMTTPLDTAAVVKTSTSALKVVDQRDFMRKEGSIWIDRVYFDIETIQRARMGGMAMTRGNRFVQDNAISWQYADQADAEKVAILVPVASREKFSALFYNTTDHAVTLTMRGECVLRGEWQLQQGLDANGDATPDTPRTQKLTFGRGTLHTLTIPARTYYAIAMQCEGATDSATPQPELADLAVSAQDVRVKGRQVNVTIHNLGCVEAPATRVVLQDANGNVVAEATTKPLEAPNDLKPRTQALRLTVPGRTAVKGLRLVIDPEGTLPEVFTTNNVVTL